MKKTNKIVRVALYGGLVGGLFTNPRKALEETIHEHNIEGWSALYFTTHRTTNIAVFIIQLAVLALTLGMWTFGGGFMVLFEKEM